LDGQQYLAVIGRVGQPGDDESQSSASLGGDADSDEISQGTGSPVSLGSPDAFDMSEVSGEDMPDMGSDSDMDMGGSPDGQSSFVAGDAPWMMSL